MSILTVCLSPGFQRSALVSHLEQGEVNRITQVYVDVSGKAVNVSRVLHALGVPTVCLGQGGDNAPDLLDLARAEGLDLELVPAKGSLRTCTSVIEPGGRVTELVEPACPVSEDCVRTLEDRFLFHLKASRALVIAGSMASGFPADFQSRLLALAKDAGLPTYIDLHGASLRQAVATRPTFVKINLSEFSATFLPESLRVGEAMGGDGSGVLDPVLAAALVRAARDLESDFILTRGPWPVLVIRNGHLMEIPVPVLPRAEIVSPIGSGDSFMAGLLAGLAAGDVLDRPGSCTDAVLGESIRLAIACAQSNARTARPGFLHDTIHPHLP